MLHIFAGKNRQGLRPRKLLAVSSGGGHWVQMMRIRQAFETCAVTFVTVHDFLSRRGPQQQVLRSQ